jgi:hypothetical protein
MTWKGEPQRHSLARRGIRTSICAPISKNQGTTPITNKRLTEFSSLVKKYEHKLKNINTDNVSNGQKFKGDKNQIIPENNPQLEWLQSEYQYLLSSGNDRELRFLKLKCPRTMRLVENKRR